MTNIEDILQKLLHRGKARARFSHGIVHARRDWSVVLIVFTLLLVALVGMSVQLFVRADTDSFVVTSEQESRGVQTIDRSMLRNVLEQFEAREALLEDLRSSAPTIGKP